MRRLFWLALTASLLGVGIWVASGVAVDAKRLTAELQRGVRRATGRELTIGGLHIVMGLAPRITAEGVALSNAAGGSAPSMLTARSLQAQVALLPLLSGQVVLENVALEGVELLVEPGPDGRLNWQFQPQRRALFDNSDSAPSPGGGGGSLALRHVHVQGGHVTWRLPGSQAVTADIGDADVSADSADASMHGAANGTAYGVPFGLVVGAGSFARLQGGPVTALAGAWPLGVTLSAAGATLKLDGGVNHPDEWRGYAFLLTGNAPDLAPLGPWLPRSLALPLKDVNLTARLSDGSNAAFRTAGLSLHAGASDLGATLPGLLLKEAVFSAPGPGQQAQVSIDGAYRGAPLRVAGTTTQPDVLNSAVPLPVTFSAEAGTASFSARGTIPPSPSANGFDLSVEVRAPNLADLSGLAGRPVPDVRDVTLDAHVGDAGFRLRGLNLRDVALESSLGDLAGNVTVAWAPVLALNGTLASKHLDLDAAEAAWAVLMPPPAQPAAGSPLVTPAPLPPSTPAPQDIAAGDRLIPDTALPFAALHGADGDLTLSIDRMNFGGEAYRDVQAKMVASSGRVVVNPLRLSAPQGVVIGGLTIDTSAAPPQVALTFRSPALSAAKVSSALGYPGGANGAMQVDAQLSATGESSRALAATLSGHLGVSLVNGSVSDALLQSALGAALSKAGVPSFGGDVAVRCFASRTDFTQGHGTVRALALDTPQMAMDGDGTIDLGAETLALHLRPALRIGGTDVAAPVSLTGGFTNMSAALDPVLGGRVGFSIGGAAPNGDLCAGRLALARGGMGGPMPAAARPQGSGPIKKPIDLLRGLFH